MFEGMISKQNVALLIMVVFTIATFVNLIFVFLNKPHLSISIMTLLLFTSMVLFSNVSDYKMDTIFIVSVMCYLLFLLCSD